MQQKTTYHKNSVAKIFFALAFLIFLSFFPATGSVNVSTFQGKAKTELVDSHEVKTPDWIKSLQKKVSLKAVTKSLTSKNYGAGLLSAYNTLTKVKFKTISQIYSSIKSPDSFIRVKTIPQNSKYNRFIS